MSELERLSVAPGGATEVSVIDESQLGAIRALWQQGKKKKAIARELDLDVKTVRKWLKERWKRQTRRSRGRILDGWSEFLRGRAPEVGFNAVALHRELRALGYEGSYVTVQRFIRPFREAARSSATVRFETGPGEQAQVDWGRHESQVAAGAVAERLEDAVLTAQEKRLLALLAEGRSYQAAAGEMIVSVNTVRNYVRSLYEKLHVHSKSEAVSKALRARLL